MAEKDMSFDAVYWRRALIFFLGFMCGFGLFVFEYGRSGEKVALAVATTERQTINQNSKRIKWIEQELRYINGDIANTRKEAGIKWPLSRPVGWREWMGAE